MRFRGLRANIALPLLLAIGVIMIAYGAVHSDSSSIIFGVIDMALSVILFASTGRTREKRQTCNKQGQSFALEEEE